MTKRLKYIDRCRSSVLLSIRLWIQCSAQATPQKGQESRCLEPSVLKSNVHNFRSSNVHNFRSLKFIINLICTCDYQLYKIKTTNINFCDEILIFLVALGDMPKVLLGIGKWFNADGILNQINEPLNSNYQNLTKVFRNFKKKFTSILFIKSFSRRQTVKSSTTFLKISNKSLAYYFKKCILRYMYVIYCSWCWAIPFSKIYSHHILLATTSCWLLQGFLQGQLL